MEFKMDDLTNGYDDNERHVTVRTSNDGENLVLSTGIVEGNVYEARLDCRQGLALSAALKALADSLVNEDAD